MIMNNVRAFLLTPFPAAVLGTAISFLSGGFPRPVSVLLLYLILFYPAQLLFGIPIRRWLLRRRRTTAVDFALGGTVMIAIPAIPYLAWATSRNGNPAVAVTLLFLWLICGGIAGLTYWWLARPDTTHRRR